MLGKAFVEYDGAIYDRFHLVTLDGFRFLLPGDRVADFERFVDDPNRDWTPPGALIRAEEVRRRSRPLPRRVS